MLVSENLSDNDIVGAGVCSMADKEDIKNMFQHHNIDKNMNKTIF